MDNLNVCNRDFGYNIAPNAGSCLGNKFSDESKLKVSLSHKGLCAGEKHPMYGKHHSKETKEKIRNSTSKENNAFYGKHHSFETREKMRISGKGKNTGEKCHKAKLTNQQVIEIKKLLTEGKYKQTEIAYMFNVGKTTINSIKSGKSWSHIELKGISNEYIKNINDELTEEKVIEVKQLLSSGISIKVIINKTGVKESRVRKIKNGELYNNIELDYISNQELKNVINGGTRSILLNADIIEINNLLKENNFSIKEISEIFNVSYQTISRIKFGLTKRYKNVN